MDPDAEILMPRRSSMLPWILFAVALVVGSGGILVEKQKADTAEFRIGSAVRAEEKARAEAAEAMTARKGLETKVQELQAENGRLSVKVGAAATASASADAKSKGKKARKHHRKHA
jgi:hypothetical protein